ncbi:DUF4190 domain-containing protein [Kineococcus indalonis]|uniref:DUF4190 domain-containing protein n=1 Tax=Kineococcus indalonis TaxID=2696566 RepID=UPI0014126688|nr:DUF4190 domain-containing protein [Kineococcus indalonis]NAZ85338.1 hypothetical protein [Kineococcus indalonis]
MSESERGGERRSWWEKPDADQPGSHAASAAAGADAQDPYRAGDPHGAGDDPYRAGEDPYRAQGDAHRAGDPYGTADPYGSADAAATRALPQDGAVPPPWTTPGTAAEHPPLVDRSAHGRPGDHDQPYGQHQHGQPYGQPGGYDQPYGQPYNQTLGAPADPYGQPPVAGTAHAVLWTAVGGLVLVFSGLGWIAAVVALAMAPGARREIVASQGARRGLGHLLAGKVVAWVTIGLTLLSVVAVVAFVAWLAGQDPSYGTSYDSVSIVTGA